MRSFESFSSALSSKAFLGLQFLIFGGGEWISSSIARTLSVSALRNAQKDPANRIYCCVSSTFVSGKNSHGSRVSWHRRAGWRHYCAKAFQYVPFKGFLFQEPRCLQLRTN